MARKDIKVAYGPLKGTKYADRVYDLMTLDPIKALPEFHGFPLMVENYSHLARREIITGRDGVPVLKLILEGGYKGRDGHFEWIIDNNNVTHRLFLAKYKK